MKKKILNLKTSDKIAILFSIFNFLSLIILLIGINIIYFFSWYSDQKTESMYDMNVNYNMYLGEQTKNNLEAFKEYILQKDTLIIPNDGGELICSNGVELKIHNDINQIKDKFFYKSEGKTYFIFTKYYDEIGEVKVFFDTTPYVNSQLIIIKISLVIIFIFIFINLWVGRIISKYSLRNLKNISNQSKEIDIEKDFKKIQIVGNKEDEINVLAEALNKSFSHIKKQTSNLKQFITDVSHEFKTPLMVINSQIDLYNKKLEKSKLTKDDTKELLHKIKDKTAKLNKLLETFFLLSRVENKIENLELNSVNLSIHLKELSNNYLLNLDKKIDLKYSIEDDIYLDIENGTFNVLIENLLGNAVKFSNKNPRIEIGLDNEKFWIKDNGIGIGNKELTKIGDKFYRTDTNKEGFGVGLFIVKRLVDLYGWKIEIDSKKGKGTKFIVKF